MVIGLVTLIIVIIIGVVLIIGTGIGIYNSIVTLRNRVENSWHQIDVQLRKRYDLIPNLVETVKGYAAHEKGVFEKVTEARANALNAEKAGDIAGSAKAENMLTGALKSLFAVAEAYPDLKANQNFLDLQQQLADTEDKIQASRRFYNGNVRDFNTKQEVFPTNMIANMFAFKKAEFFEIENEEEKKNVEVKF